MAKNPTTWANNDVKPPANWTPATKPIASWADNVTKHPALYTPVTKNADSWGHSTALQTYFYDDANITYDSVLTEYNYLVNNNQLDQKGVTLWSAA
jgi:hypothetical protein